MTPPGTVALLVVVVADGEGRACIDGRNPSLSNTVVAARYKDVERTVLVKSTSELF